MLGKCVRVAYRRLVDAPYAAMAWATCVALSAWPNDSAMAQAAGGIGDAARRVADTFNNIGTVLLGAMFLGGVGLTGSGLMKLKEASENHGHGQAKYGDAIWRLAAGVGLAGVPSVIAITGTTLFGSSTVGEAGVGRITPVR